MLLAALLICLAGGVVFGVNGTVRRRRQLRRRMAPITNLFESVATSAVAAPAAAAQTGPERPLASMLDVRFPLAGGMRAGAIALLSGLGTAGTAAGALAFFGLPALIVLLAAAGIGALVIWTVGSATEERMRQRFQERFLVVIEDIHRMVRFGIPMGQALESSAGAAEDPVGPSLRRVCREADLGTALSAAIAHEAHRIHIHELAMLAAIVSTQSRSGGGLAESVANLADMLRERVDNRARIKAATAESKISLIILAFVPLAAIGIQVASQPELVQTLLSTARHLLGIGAGLIATGLAVAWLLVSSARK